MSLVSDLIEETRDAYLLAGQREPMNRLTSTITNSTTNFTLDFDLNSLGQGSRLSIDLEDMLVWDTNATAKTITVQRGTFGSTAAAHSSGALVLSGAKWSPFRVFKAINEELRSLSSP